MGLNSTVEFLPAYPCFPKNLSKHPSFEFSLGHRDRYIVADSGLDHYQVRAALSILLPSETLQDPDNIPWTIPLGHLNSLCVSAEPLTRVD